MASAYRQRHSFQIYFYLQNYVGSKGRLDTTLEFYAAGTHDPANQVFVTRIEYRKAKMSPSGWFLTTLSLSGHADIYVTVPRFLRRKITNVSTGDHPVVRTTLIIGDVNGDNVVDMKDYNLVKAKLGILTTETVDVDGDGKVTQHDLDLITANMDIRGD